MVRKADVSVSPKKAGDGSSFSWLHVVSFLIKTGIVLILGGWAGLAIRFSNLPNDGMRWAGVAVFVFLGGGIFVFVRSPRSPFRWFLAVVLGVAVWWAFIPAAAERKWVSEHRIQSHAEVQGDRVTIYNVRDFDYRTEEDFEVRYVDKTFDLNELTTVDFVKSHWDGLINVAHTLLTFGFQDRDYLTVSVETRKEVGEPQTSIRGLFKQYELIYVLGTETDLIRLRTNFRREEVYLYPTVIPPEEVRVLFLDILERATGLKSRPEFYNTITHNCTTSLIPHLEKARRRTRSCDLRLLLNGQTDRMAFENGTIRTEFGFEETKRLHHINRYVADESDPEDYSSSIRPHLARSRAGGVPGSADLDER